MSNKEISTKIFNSYNDYVLSKNICMILKQFGYQKINKNSLLLLTGALNSFIEMITIKSKQFTELSGRVETNMIDLLFSLIQNDITQLSIINYINNSNIKDVAKIDINKEIENEKKKDFYLLKQLNSINVPKSSIINKKFLDAIPKNLRYFPREFTLKSSENIIEKNQKFKKRNNEIKKIEKKDLENIISSNEYYDLSKKRNRQTKEIDIIPIYAEITKGLNEHIQYENGLFGKRFKLRNEREIKNEKNKEIQDTNINNNIDNNQNIEKQIFDK